MRIYNIRIENIETNNVIEFQGIEMDKVKSYLTEKWFDNEYRNINSIRPQVMYRTNKKNRRLKN